MERSGAAGSLAAMAEIRHATLIRSPRERVYDALTTPAGLDAWFTTDASIEDGELVWRWREWGPDRITGEDRGPILEDRPPERLVFQWRAELNPPTTVEVAFEEHADGTVVRLREHGYGGGIAPMLECAVGWGEALTLLKFHLEHGLRY